MPDRGGAAGADSGSGVDGTDVGPAVGDVSWSALEATDGVVDVAPLASSWLALGVFAPLGFALRYAHERAVREEKEVERAQVMDIFSRCVSAAVAEELWQRRDQIALGGETRVVTVAFTDIRGFTTLSESADSSAEVVAWLETHDLT